jgi:hypothetical protein
MSGGNQQSQVVGNDMLLMILYLTAWLKATADKIAIPWN